MTGDTAVPAQQGVPRPPQRRPLAVEPVEAQARHHQRLELFCVLALATIYLVWFAWPAWWSASQNARLLGSFSSDEYDQLLLLRQAIDLGTVRLGYYYYGYAYLNMALLPLLLCSRVTEVTDQQIIVWLRIIPTLFAAASVSMTFVLARRYFGRPTAWLSALLLSVSVRSFLRMSVMAHSDIPQLFFLLLGAYWCCRFVEDGRLGEWFRASAAAGVAFSCKYSGLLLLPVMGLFGVLQTSSLDAAKVRVNSARIVRVARLLTAVAGTGLLFLGSVVLPRAAAPYAGAEYYGVSMSSFFRALRLVALASGAVLVLLALLRPAWAFVGERRKLARLLQLGVLSATVFALSVILTSPLHIFDVQSGVVRGFLYESLHAAFGHVFRAESDAMRWLALLSSRELLHPLVVALAGLGLALWAYRLVRRGRQALLEPQSVIWVWTLGYLGLLFLRVNTRTHRALLPVVPFLLVLAANAARQAIRWAGDRMSRRHAFLLTAASMLVVLGLVLPPALQRLLAFRRATIQRVEVSPAVEAGEWLEAHFPPSTRVLYDPYSYVPPAFADARITPWGGTPELLEQLRPDVVMVYTSLAADFRDAVHAGAYAREDAEYLAKHEYYRTLRSGEAGYALQRDFGIVQVYVRRSD